jgi:glycerol-3-phosphate O-acyltransferase / dihydroxyacetone phosphate acyltransferase
MLWYILRITMSFAFPVFFKRIQMKHASRIREKGPMFITINHPSAFMDPMTFSWIVFHPRTRYMARGDAFKKGLANTALQSMGIVPIYRMRDGGIENVRKNLDSFKVAYDLLDKNQKIMVFAEGICVQERRLRSIQKGTAKMAFTYLDNGGHDNLKIMPVGLHYSTPSKFRGDVFVQIGEPILVKDYYEAYKQQPAQTIVKLTAVIEEKMSELVPSLAHKENDLLIEQLQPILKEQFLEENKLSVKDLEQHHKYWVFISDRLNQLTEKDPVQMETFRKEVNSYIKLLHQTKIEDKVVRNAAENKNTITFFKFILLVLGFPFYLVGVILNKPAYYLAQKIARKTSNGKEFFASVSFGSWALLTQLFFLIELLILWFVFDDLFMLLYYTTLKITTAIIGLHYAPFKKEMLSGFRLKKLKDSNRELYQMLINQRNNILGFIGDFH